MTAEVPLWRLYLLRAAFLLMVVGLGVFDLPRLFVHPPGTSGVVPSILGGLWLLALLGLRHPLAMLPILLFELAWKAIWVLLFGWPLWRSGAMTADQAETLQATMMGVVIMPLVIPWGYAVRRYLTGAGERWR